MARKGQAEAEKDNSERWLLTYSDLITLLLVFFVAMYSISKADEHKFGKLNASLQRAFNVLVLQGDETTATGGEFGPSGGNQMLDDFLGVRTRVLKMAEHMGVQSQVRVSLQKDGIVISMSGNLLFDSGRADLRPESIQLLARISEQLKGLSNEIRVEGHTDNIPVETDQFPTNWELSSARATAVTRYLVEVGGVPPQRISAQGFAEHKPLTNNDSRESRAQNRRVDIVIIYPNAEKDRATPSPTPDPDSTTWTGRPRNPRP